MLSWESHDPKSAKTPLLNKRHNKDIANESSELSKKTLVAEQKPLGIIIDKDL